MPAIERNPGHDEIEALIEEMIENELLSGDAQEEVESLLDDGRYTEAGVLAVGESSREQFLAPESRGSTMRATS